MSLTLNRVYTMDCLEGLARIEPGSIDLAFADPPFNIGYSYDVYHDDRPTEEYLQWSRQWMAAVVRVLKPTGTFWLAIGDEYAAELKLIAQRDLGLVCRSWVIWYYTFGVNCVRAFSRSHTHLLYFVKDPEHFTFHGENPAVRIPSARQLVYADARANPRGRLPDNTWILRPQDVPWGFAPHHDVWYFARVAGTFREREGFHGCQMPEQLLGRIIRCCSDPLEIVLDPFAGSGTTLVVAKKLGRRWIGFEVSRQYVAHIERRLAEAAVGDPLDGPADPLSSAPPTAAGKRRRVPIRVGRGRRLPAIEEFHRRLLAAYRSIQDGTPLDHLLIDPARHAEFVACCRRNRLPGNEVVWLRTLLLLRKTGKLPRTGQRTRGLRPAEVDLYGFGSEVALQRLSVECQASLDELLSDPQLAAWFDELAAAYAPGFSPRQYRQAAMGLRKAAHRAKRAAVALAQRFQGHRLPPKHPFCREAWAGCARPAVYLLFDAEGHPLYVGSTLDLRRRMEQTANTPAWSQLGIAAVRWWAPPESPEALRSYLIGRFRPPLNWAGLAMPTDCRPQGSRPGVRGQTAGGSTASG